MQSLLSQTISVFGETLDPRLFDLDSKNKTIAMLEHLAPVPLVGFECRLTDGDSQVDVQQGFNGDDRAELCDYAQHVLERELDDEAPWINLVRFSNEWISSESVIGEFVNEVWLEFDLPQTASDYPPPSIFLGVKNAQRRTVEVIEHACHILIGGKLPKRLKHHLDRCIQCVPVHGSFCHFGMMLSRPTQALRVNVKGLDFTQTIHYLTEIGWPGDLEKLNHTLRELHQYFDSVRLCLDIEEHIYPHIAFECFLWHDQDASLKSPKMLNMLVESGLCSSAKRSALLEWPVIVRPVDSRSKWPTRFIFESLVRDVSDFSAISRTLNHIKVTWLNESAVSAKAYLGLEHSWVNVD